MVTQWDRFNRRASQTIADLGGEDAIEITFGSGGYQGIGTGDTYSYPDTSDAILDAETRAPSAVSGVEDSGTFEGVDQMAFVAPLVGSRTYESDATIESGETVTLDSVTIQSGVTLTVNGRLQVNSLTVDGTLVDNNVVRVYGDLYDSIVPYGDAEEPPTRVLVKENGVTYEVQSKTKQGDGYTRLMLMELD